MLSSDIERELQGFAYDITPSAEARTTRVARTNEEANEENSWISEDERVRVWDDFDISADCGGVASDDEIFRSIPVVPVEEAADCSICCDQMKEETKSRPNNCKHEFCFDCIRTWSQKTNICPLCKGEFRSIIRIKSGDKVKVRKKRLRVSDGSSEEEQTETEETDQESIPPRRTNIPPRGEIRYTRLQTISQHSPQHEIYKKIYLSILDIHASIKPH